MSKKVPISISKEWMEEIDFLGRLMGLTPQVYGYIPKILRFSITYTVEGLKMDEKHIPDLKPEEIDVFFSSIKKLREKRKALEKALEAAEKAEKV